MIKRVLGNPFFKNVAILSSGTIISQIVVVLTSFFLARLYNAQDFGVLSLFTSVNLILVIIFTGRYELAIGLPKLSLSGKKLLLIVFFLGGAFSLFYLFLIFLEKKLFHFFHNELFLSPVIYLAPLYTFLIAFNSGLVYWNQRNKKYKKVAFSSAVQVISNALIGLLFGFYKIEQGLIISLIIGSFISVTYMFFSEFKLKDLIISQNDFKRLIKEYDVFPKFSLWSDLATTMSQQYIPIIFSILFSPYIVGLYSFSNRILRLPNILITGSISNVFRNDAIDRINLYGECNSLFISTFKKLVFMAIPVYSLLFVVAPEVFAIAFGEEWREAGYFARILSVLLMIEFVTLPLNTLFNVKQEQKRLMKIQLFNFLLGFLLVIIGYTFFKSAFWALSLYSASTISFNLYTLSQSYYLSKRKLNE